MLCITLLPNEYLTVGSDIVIQYDRLSGERVHLAIHAPREIPIIRGEVLERQGGRRPDCVTDMAPRHVRQLPWNSQKKQALAELRQTPRGSNHCRKAEFYLSSAAAKRRLRRREGKPRRKPAWQALQQK